MLADLGIFKYETVAFSRDSRAFHSRADIDAFFELYECRRRLHEDLALTEVLAGIPRQKLHHEWLESRRGKLIFQIAREYERNGEAQSAFALYSDCTHPGARLRAIRVLETSGRFAEAYGLAADAAARPESAAEKQKLARVLGTSRAPPAAGPWGQTPAGPARAGGSHRAIGRRPAARWSMPCASTLRSLPRLFTTSKTRSSIHCSACCAGDAIFTPVSGAFFHPFHVGPADLFSPAFRTRRARQFEACLERLGSDEYRSSIIDRYHEKLGIQSPFVFWDLLNEDLLASALDCIPGAHLRAFFERLLLDLRENRSGLPDLIQFWVPEKRYRMIEVKGPGDRLQDNQQRWMQFCLENRFPVAVCHVRWA